MSRRSLSLSLSLSRCLYFSQSLFLSISEWLFVYVSVCVSLDLYLLSMYVCLSLLLSWLDSSLTARRPPVSLRCRLI